MKLSIMPKKKPRRILIAPDKFKGSLTASEAAKQMAAGWREVFPGDEIILHPVADGGDGTLAVVAEAASGEWISCQASDARGRTRSVRYWRHDQEAWIESAAVCGLAELPASEHHPLTATTFGLGEVLSHAHQSGATRIFLCLGGSATNDAGCGMAAALGFRFFDKSEIAFDPRPSELHRLVRIERPSQPLNMEVIALSDVQNPLLGPEGATYVYAPQKGASKDDLPPLENALAQVARLATHDLGAPLPSTPGAGAAGGLGFGVIAFLQGTLCGGFEAIAALTGLAEAVRSADLVLTGEGRIDTQTASGKAPAGVARLAREAGKPILAFGGSVPREGNPLFDAALPITHEPMSLEQAMTHAAPLLRAASTRLAKLIALA